MHIQMDYVVVLYFKPIYLYYKYSFFNKTQFVNSHDSHCHCDASFVDTSNLSSEV